MIFKRVLHVRRCISKATWEEAEKEFPSYTKEERLSSFLTLKLKGGVPQPIRDNCQAAIDSKGMKKTLVYTTVMDGNRAFRLGGELQNYHWTKNCSENSNLPRGKSYSG